MQSTKVVVIGAGSASFGLNTLGAIMKSDQLRGSTLALVDRNAETLAIVKKLAERLNREWDRQLKLETYTHHAEALPGAKFVVSAIEVPPRERLWRSDYEIPLRHGVRQPYAENGGPGGFAHAARNIGPVLEIAHDMEKYCPDAWYINYTNPMVRICDAVHRYSKIKVIGLCHQIYAGYGIVGYLLADVIGMKLNRRLSTFASPEDWADLRKVMHAAVEQVDIKAAGLNHFTFMLSVHLKKTGEDLYPLVRQRFSEVEPDFEPLTHRVFDAFGLMPIPGDSHLCEYLPWVTDPLTKPYDKYKLHLYDWDGAEKGRNEGYKEITAMGNGEKSIDHLKTADSEGALEMIENIAGAGNHYHVAVNLPNEGQIENLPNGAIVETPGHISGLGAKGVSVGSLPTGVAELHRRELEVVRLAVDAAATGDRQLALQCLLLDPVTSDLDVAKEVLDDYLVSYKQYLPQFWK
jgi:alpha-galactosidase